MEECVETSVKGTSEQVMDTPERSKNGQIAASISKFEDSPVYNFLNTLSPINIMPVKSTHITQTINPLSFASIPSVFTSPHVRESRFLRRHQLSDPSIPEFSSSDGIMVDKDAADNATKQLNEQKTSADGEVSEESSYDCSKFVVDLDERYDCASSDSNLKSACCLEAQGMRNYACSSSALIPSIHEHSRRGEVNMEVPTQIDQNKEVNWEQMISDTSDLLIFESPKDRDSYNESVDPRTSFSTSINGDMHSLHLSCTMDSGEQVVAGNEAENLSTQPGEEIEMDNADGSSSSNPDESVDHEHLGIHRGMRRRCLVFEMGGGRRKHVEENSGSDSSVWLHSSDGNALSNEQKLASVNRGNESLPCLLPGIGLHLNALATTPKDHRIANHDSSASARLLIGPSSVVNIHPSTNNQGLLDTILPVAPSDMDIVGMENAFLPVESGYTVNDDESCQGSPKKKRRKAEQAGEGESCKRCNCKRSKCLKLYCECFAAGVYCVEPCACIDCYNKPTHEETVLATRKQIESRNPLAFAPKVIRGSDSPSETGQDDSSKTPASARHKRGCNCKKSGCLKKYCECYQGGVGCSVNCRCEGCKNAFGRKDGMETDAEEEETDAAENNLDSAAPATPLRGGRPSGELRLKKPPRSSSSSFLPRQGLRKPSFFPPPPKFETIKEDEIPEFLQGGCADGGIKLSSPNGKRVSPPHTADMSPGLRSSRKLILQSIPSFPSLNSNQ